MTNFSWTCPFCDRPVTITESSVSNQEHWFKIENADGERVFVTTVIVCPNPKCHKFSFHVNEFNVKSDHLGNLRKDAVLHHWNLIPPSRAKVLPSYIPQAIKDDYTEACLIVEPSPKASATLSRRCLQGMIRGFFGVSKARLVDEIEAIKDKVDPTTWAAIDAVRSIGNIGAHMEKDINVIVDVDPGEAEELIKLIELLIEDWYVNKYKRETQLKAVLKIKAEKDAAKKLPPTAPTHT
jgi:hypothetical protein